MKTTIVMALAMMAIALRTVEAQCYQFSSGATASLTVNITHLPPPTMPQPGIYQYTSSSGLAGDISLTVGQTTYTPVSSIPVSFDITVSSDATLNFSVLDLSVGFTTANQTVAAASLSVDWSAALFPNGTLPAALPPISGSIPSTMVVGVEFVDTTYTLTSATSCSTGPSGTSALSVAISHIGGFLQGQPFAQYSVLVHNGGTAPTSGTVFVTDFLPPGLTASIASGPGWACNTQPICSRSDALPAGGSYPLITVTVSVAPFASSQVSNQVTVSGGGSATATASDPTTILPAFTDVMPSDSFLPAIDLLKEFGITSGCSAQPPLYCSTSNITEAQMAVFIVRSVIGGDNFTYTQTPYFSDVPASYLYFPWIQKMQDLGIAVSCGVNEFCPETPVTRGIMAVLIIRGRYGTSIPTSYPTTAYFTDVTPAYPFFPWIQKMKEQGITTGCTPTTYCPDTPVTRGQMAVFIIRGMFNLLLPSPVISSGLTFGAGQYLIGKDIPAGRYYTVPAVAGGCYWERLSGLGGSLGEIIANDFIEAGFAQAIVDIAASDLAFSTNANCGTWYNTPRLGAQSSIPSGTWLVGAQIAPGTYQASAQSGCYWERLRDFSGSLSAIITNDFVSSAGNQLVSIAASDVGFSSTAECGVWTRVSSQLLSSQSAESPAEVKNRNWLMKRSKGVRIQTPLGER